MKLPYCIYYLPCLPLEDNIALVCALWIDTDGTHYISRAVVHRGSYPDTAFLDVPLGVMQGVGRTLERWQQLHQRPEERA